MRLGVLLPHPSQLFGDDPLDPHNVTLHRAVTDVVRRTWHQHGAVYVMLRARVHGPSLWLLDALDREGLPFEVVRECDDNSHLWGDEAQARWRYFLSRARAVHAPVSGPRTDLTKAQSAAFIAHNVETILVVLPRLKVIESPELHAARVAIHAGIDVRCWPAQMFQDA